MLTAILKSTRISLVENRMLLLCMLTMILTSLTACKTHVLVVSQDQQEVRLKAGQTAPSDGWFMNDARYQRYRRAVADKIMVLEEQK